MEDHSYSERWKLRLEREVSVETGIQPIQLKNLLLHVVPPEEDGDCSIWRWSNLQIVHSLINLFAFGGWGL